VSKKSDVAGFNNSLTGIVCSVSLGSTFNQACLLCNNYRFTNRSFIFVSSNNLDFSQFN